MCVCREKQGASLPALFSDVVVSCWDSSNQMTLFASFGCEAYFSGRFQSSGRRSIQGRKCLLHIRPASLVKLQRESVCDCVCVCLFGLSLLPLIPTRLLSAEKSNRNIVQLPRESRCSFHRLHSPEAAYPLRESSAGSKTWHHAVKRQIPRIRLMHLEESWQSC